MQKTFFFLSICLLTLTFSTAFGQTNDPKCKTTSTLISGTYQGKNLFFQTTPNAIEKLTINDKVMGGGFNVSAFEVNLSDLKVAQKYEIKVYFCEGTPTPYKLLNPEAVK